MFFTQSLKYYLRPIKPFYRCTRNLVVQFRMLFKSVCFLFFHGSFLDIGMHAPPKGYHQTTSRWFAKNQLHLGKADSDYREVTPPREIRPIKLRTTGRPVDWRYKGNRCSEIPLAFVARIPEGRVYGEFGEVIAPDGRILADISFVYGHRVFAERHEHPLFARYTLPPVKPLQGLVCLLATQHGDYNYFHWMFNVLPRLELFRMAGTDLDSVDAFIVNRLRFSFHSETLLHLGIPLNKVIESHDTLHVRVENLLITPSLRAGFHMAEWVCSFLRRKFLESKSGKKCHGARKIYISREDAENRKIVNESECISLLVSAGFAKVTLSGMSVEEQVSIFSSAVAIVAPHGAGLANLVFCSPGTRVVELFSPAWLRSFYWELSNCVGLDYYYLVGKTNDSARKPDVWKDYTIDLDELSEIIAIAGLKQ